MFRFIDTTVSTPTASTGTGATGSSLTPGSTQTGVSTGTTTPGQGVSTGSTASYISTILSTLTSTGTTTKRCEEMQAVDEQTSKQIKVTPVDVSPDQKSQFQPTSKQGVSFPSNETTPTIIVYFGKPAEVQSVTIPRDQITGANVQQFTVTFYSPYNNKINQQPIYSTSSPKDDKNKPAQVDSNQIPSYTRVSRVEITIVQTTNGESPKGVVLDIKACTESTTG